MSFMLKRYSDYKTSGVAWIGNVPKHWDVVRLGTLLKERGENNHRGQVTDVLSVLRDVGVIPYKEKGNIGNKASEDITRYKIVRPGDIVVNSMNVIIGSVGLSRHTGCLSPVYYVLQRRAETDDPGYLDLFFQSKPFQQSLVRIGNGILAHRMRIPMELLKAEPFPHPPAEEQSVITRFISHMDARVRKVIRAKQRVIELLNAEKQAILSTAFSAIEASTIRIRSLLLAIEQGWSPVAAEGELMPDQYAVLTLSAVRRGAFNPSALKPLDQTVDVPISLELCDGDLLLTRSNTRERVGDTCIVDNVRPHTIFSDLIYRLCIDERLATKKFVMYALLSPLGRAQIERDARGSSGTMPKLSQPHIKDWRIPFPDLSVQNATVLQIESEFAGLSVAINRAEREIALIREYRTRLIADVVTGKLDVRGVEVPEVNGVEETETNEELEAEEELVAADGDNDAVN